MTLLYRLAACASLFSFAAPLAAQRPTTRLLFESGKDGYKRYRIPALLVTPKGTVLAFCEGRKDGRGLTGNIDLVLKRSLDRGHSWESLELVADDDGHTLGNPCPVVDPQTGILWLALTRSNGQDLEDEIVKGTSRETTRVYITHSKDEGKTWAPMVDLSATCRKPDWTWYGTGPGVGIALKSGRLLIPSYHAEGKAGTYRSHAIFSDDHGKTWKLGATVGADVSECQAVERADGKLLLSMRTLTAPQERTFAESGDGGATWSTTWRDSRLYDPSCQSSIYALPQGGWLTAHPAGPTGRRNLTVRWSGDEGKSWSPGLLLRAGDAQYSSIAQLDDVHVGCLFESWVDGNYHIFFARFERKAVAVKPGF